MRQETGECECESWSVMSHCLQPHGLFSPWNSPGQNIRVGSLSLIQGIFPTPKSNIGLPHCRQKETGSNAKTDTQTLYCLVVNCLVHSPVWLFVTSWTPARFSVLHYLPEFDKFMSIESVIPSNHLILCHHFCCPQSFPASVFINELALFIRWSKYWSFSFSINPSSEYSGLISFRIDWFDLGVQGTLKSLL